MSNFFKIIVALVMAVVILTVFPAQVFADSTPEYISEVKIGMGKDESAAAAALEGYKILKSGDQNVDLNQDAGGGWGSKGDKVVYLGYKTTTDKTEAITDLALMNMKGGYSVQEYEALMELQMKSQIIPFVDNFLAAIKEYRINFSSSNETNKQRAEFVHDTLNKFIDDDTGKGLGDLLLEETKYEMGDDAYNKLSEEEKKNHADILTIICQSNGKAIFLVENLITMAADTNDSTWIDRLTVTTYDDIVESMDMLPSDAETALAREYEDDANKILDMWDTFREELLNYDTYFEAIESFDEEELENTTDTLLNEETASDEEVAAAFGEYADAQENVVDYCKALQVVSVHDRLEEYEYGDGTLLDYFTQSYEDVSDDITIIYPLVASLTDGQRAGLDFVVLSELCNIGLSDYKSYIETSLEDFTEISIYDGVDRGIYAKGGVALTSDALRDKAMKESVEENSRLSKWTWAMIAVSGAMFVAAAASLTAFATYSIKLKLALRGMDTTSFDVISKYIYSERIFINKYGEQVREIRWADKVYSQRASICGYLTIGFSVAMVIFSAITTYLAYRDLVNYYDVDFTPIPHYMVDEKDITAYNEKGEKIVLKNQSAYYKAVECNRTESDEMFDVLGACADMNGDVGKQWLALYAVKNEAMAPIIADSFAVRINDNNIPADYQTGIHMFGSMTAFDLNNGLYVWNKNAPSIMVYFKTDNAAAVSVSGSSFTTGNLALVGIAGLGLGAAVTALVATVIGRRKKASA